DPVGLPTLTRDAEGLIAWRGRVYFTTDAGVVSTDGTRAGTQAEPGFASYEATILGATENGLFYRSQGFGPNDRHLRVHRSDGTDQRMLPGLYFIDLIGELPDRILFSYYDGSGEQPELRLAASDGTMAGTYDLAEPDSLQAGIAFEGEVYFGRDHRGL